MQTELIQVLTTDRSVNNYETLCTVNKTSNFIMGNGYSRKANDIINALQKTYTHDTFRITLK